MLKICTSHSPVHHGLPTNCTREVDIIPDLQEDEHQWISTHTHPNRRTCKISSNVLAKSIYIQTYTYHRLVFKCAAKFEIAFMVFVLRDLAIFRHLHLKPVLHRLYTYNYNTIMAIKSQSITSTVTSIFSPFSFCCEVKRNDTMFLAWIMQLSPTFSFSEQHQTS